MAKKKQVLTTRLAAYSNVTGTPLSVTYATQKQAERPTTLNDIFKRCRVLRDGSNLTDGQSNYFVSAYMALRKEFSNFELKITSVDPAKAKSVQEKLDEEVPWKAEYTDPVTKLTVEVEWHMTIREAIEKLVDDIWSEFLLMDSAILLWTDGGSIPTTLTQESCTYTESMGIPVLKWTHGLSRTEIEQLNDDSLKKRMLAANYLLISPSDGEHFKVLKRGRIGSGLPKPSLQAMFTVLGEIESKQQGLHAQAYFLRSAVRHHKIGHLIANGPFAGRSNYFWSKLRDAETRKAFGDKVGPRDFTSNFDHLIEYPFPELTRFGKALFEGSDHRLNQWGGPIARMITEGTSNIENNLALAKGLCSEDRRMMSEFLSVPLNLAFKFGDNLKLTWSDEIFYDPIRAADLLKFAVNTGLVSIQGARDRMGYDDEVESRNKVGESDDPDAKKKFAPIFDGSHGTFPSLDPSPAEIATAQAKAKAKGQSPDSQTGRPAGASTSV